MRWRQDVAVRRRLRRMERVLQAIDVVVPAENRRMRGNHAWIEMRSKHFDQRGAQFLGLMTGTRMPASPAALPECRPHGSPPPACRRPWLQAPRSARLRCGWAGTARRRRETSHPARHGDRGGFSSTRSSAQPSEAARPRAGRSCGPSPT
jgi:hypothetical protein